MPKKEPKLIDTHTHVNFKDFKDDGDTVIERTLKEGTWLINVGAQYSTSKRAVEYAQKYEEGVYAAVGLHPLHVSENGKTGRNGKEFEEFDGGKYYGLLQNEKVVAVGEIGLDYKGTSEKAKIKQREVLTQQIDLAQFSGKPIIFHCRKAYDDLLNVFETFGAGCAQCPHACAPKIRGVVHSFMGSWSCAEKFLEKDFYLGFNGLVAYARDYDKVLRNMPIERLLLETDAPYLTPEPHRGKRNEPSYVKYVAKAIAKARGESFEKIARQTTKNARELFGV